MPTVRPRTTQYLWEFLLELLDGKEACPAISWTNRDKGEFVLRNQDEIAKLWGKVKGRPRMDKIKLGRALRYYYKKKLLAKVPKKKAMYRFVKIDFLEQKVQNPIKDDIEEIDFSEINTLDFIEDENNGSGSLSSFQDKDQDDMPLENLLVEKRDIVFLDQKYQKLFPMETDNCQIEFSNISNRSIECSNSLNADGYANYKNYGLDNMKCEDFETIDYFKNASTPTNGGTNNSEYSDFGGNPLASLVMRSMLIGDNLPVQEPRNFKEDVNSQQPACGFPAQAFSSKSSQLPTNHSVRGDPVNHSTMPSLCFDNPDSDSAFNGLKEFERLIMLNTFINL